MVNLKKSFTPDYLCRYEARISEMDYDTVIFKKQFLEAARIMLSCRVLRQQMGLLFGALRFAICVAMYFMYTALLDGSHALYPIYIESAIVKF